MSTMKRWVTEYANAADDGAPYAGPIVFAENADGAKAIAQCISGPNGEVFTVLGELLEQMDATVHGDTHTVIRRLDGPR